MDCAWLVRSIRDIARIRQAHEVHIRRNVPDEVIIL